jgi:ATP-binding cassette subfamily F protein uup
MATLLSARNLTKSFPSSNLFSGISLSIEEKDRIGMIGPNGAGKSTLMKILADLEFSDEGDLTRRRGLKLVYIEQDDSFEKDATPISAICDALKDGPEDRLDIETRAAITLSKLGIENFERAVDTLSGGWRKRLAIARALCHEPDVLLLDEPTNHRDLAGVLWLEAFAARATMAMVFVTHDRRFLENAATRILELSPAYPTGMFEAAGNYSKFIERKNDFLDAQEATESALANKVRRDTAWLRQGIQGRQTRNKTQVVAASDRRAELKSTKGRNAAPKKTTTIDFQATDRKTKKLLALHSVGKSMGEKPLFHSLDLILTPGRRLGLLGVNGAGKTTLLRLMSGDLKPDAGTIKRAADLRVVTFSQHRDSLNPTQTLQEALCPFGDMVDYRGKQVHVTGWARRFLFDPDQLATKVSNLSGGEQARVLIANLMLEPADVLLLDEPTNDLDIPSLEVLEDALLEFPGAIVLVTHDRFMLERVATEYVGLDDCGGIKEFQTFEQWITHRGTLDTVARQNRGSVAAKTAPPKPARKKRSYKNELEYKGMEAAILEAELAVVRLQEVSEDPVIINDHVKAAKTFEELSKAQDLVAERYARWAELEA